MALFILRGITRSPYTVHRSIGLQNFYSDKKAPDDKPASNHDDSTKTKTQKKLDEIRTKITEKEGEVRTYFFGRFFDYVKNYDQLVAKKYPKAFKVYRVFMDGVKNFGSDMKDYLKITTKLFGEPEKLKQLTRAELEVYYQLPHDIRKVGPLLLVSSIPFAQYITMPLAYMYPRKLLTHQFWTPQQRSEFFVLELQDRLANNRRILRLLQAKSSQIKNDPNYPTWKHIIAQLGSGMHPTVDEIIKVKDIFAEMPYKTASLSYTHVKYLCGLHGIKSIFFKTSRLANRAMMFHFMDMAILREGGLSKLTSEELRFCCFARGLNASNLSNDELIKWLEQWIEVSKVINPTNFSLYLHLPILLTYNHPNNWKLIYHER